MTEDQELRTLLIKYQAGKASDEEIALLESRYMQWNAGKYPKLSEFFFEESDRLMWQSISARTGIQSATGQLNVWLKVGAAAAILTILLSILLWTTDNKSKKMIVKQSPAQRITPGKQGATLTLASGKTIRLTDAAKGELASEAGAKIIKSADGKILYELSKGNIDPNQVNILSTAKGESFELLLPDGSKVQLNAASSLKYSPSLMRDGKRRVELHGEGYFTVAKDNHHPFVVSVKGQQVEVLGTSFNLNAYDEEPSIKTTLIEGKVKVSAGIASKIMEPGDEAVTNGNRIILNKVDPSFAVAWKNNKFIFDGGDIKSVMRMLERWYNVEVVYQGKMSTETLYGTVSRFDDISHVLRILEAAGDVQCKIVGRKIYVADKKTFYN